MKYIVLKTEDVEKYCSFEQQEQLMEICGDIHAGRFRAVKEEENRYLVVNVDEPYAHNVRTLIEEHEGEAVSFD